MTPITGGGGFCVRFHAFTRDEGQFDGYHRFRYYRRDRVRRLVGLLRLSRWRRSGKAMCMRHTAPISPHVIMWLGLRRSEYVVASLLSILIAAFFQPNLSFAPCAAFAGSCGMRRGAVMGAGSHSPVGHLRFANVSPLEGGVVLNLRNLARMLPLLESSAVLASMILSAGCSRSVAARSVGLRTSLYCGRP